MTKQTRRNDIGCIPQFAIIILFVCVIGCNALHQRKVDKAYNVVSVDVTPTERNRKIILNKCVVTFPTDAKTKTDIVHTVEIDSAENQTLKQTIAQLNAYIAGLNCVADTQEIARIIQSTLKPTVITVTDKTTIHDSIPYYPEHFKFVVLQDENNQLRSEHLKDQNTIQETEKKVTARNRVIWILSIMILVFAAGAILIKRFA